MSEIAMGVQRNGDWFVLNDHLELNNVRFNGGGFWDNG